MHKVIRSGMTCFLSHFSELFVGRSFEGLFYFSSFLFLVLFFFFHFFFLFLMVLCAVFRTGLQCYATDGEITTETKL